MIKIDKGIKIPQPLHKKYPFKNMKRGDSFFAKTTTTNITSQAISFRLRNNLKWQFVVKKVRKGARIWRKK